jgi:hypothetical protein
MPTQTGLAFTVKAKSKARFAVAVADPAVVLNADWQDWDDSEGHIRGFVRSERRVEVVKLSTAGFHLTRANLPVLAVKENPGALALRLAAPGQETPQVSLRSDRQLHRATLGGEDLQIRKIGRTYELQLPLFTKESDLVLYFGETSR